jgi:predicted Fe-S protein YdhL (DUF1289 family)
MTPPAIPSPCRQICRLGPDELCDGCGRSLTEIARWGVLSAAERRAVMDRVAGWRIRGPAIQRPD